MGTDSASPQFLELSLREAARTHPRALALLIDGQHHTFEELSQKADSQRRVIAEHWDGETALALACTPDLDAFLFLYACLEQKVPLLLIHPRWSPLLRDQIVQRVEPLLIWKEGSPRIVKRSASTRLAAGTQFLIATSGSRGTPKIVQLGSAGLLASARASKRNIPWQEDDRWLLSLPFAHIGGLSVLIRCLTARKTVVCEALDPKHPHFNQDLDRLGVTLLSLVPAQLDSWCRQSQASPARVRAILIGGSACPPELHRLARSVGFPVLRTYGLSEMSSQVATETLNQGSINTPPLEGNVGQPLEGVEFKIGAEQQLYLRGPGLMLGYLGEAPDPAPDHGWFPTQDRCRIESDGSLSVLGRLDHVIISGGENISPEAVEAALLPLLEVEALCVVGLSDPHWGEKLVAAVILKSPHDGTHLPRALITGWNRQAESRLPDYARPKAYYAVESFPLSEGGKLDRAALRVRVAELNAKSPFQTC